jgi:hypothetical protein
MLPTRAIGANFGQDVMIIRAIMALGSVWLLMPHHPDLGLPAPPAVTCDADTGCSLGATDQTREAIFQRLRAIRREIQTDGVNREGLVSNLVYGREDGVRKMRGASPSNRRLSSRNPKG